MSAALAAALNTCTRGEAATRVRRVLNADLGNGLHCWHVEPQRFRRGSVWNKRREWHDSNRPAQAHENLFFRPRFFLAWTTLHQTPFPRTPSPGPPCPSPSNIRVFFFSSQDRFGKAKHPNHQHKSTKNPEKDRKWKKGSGKKKSAKFWPHPGPDPLQHGRPSSQPLPTAPTRTALTRTIPTGTDPTPIAPSPSLPSTPTWRPKI